MTPTDDRQYSLTTILGLWALVALPMGFIRFVALPWALTWSSVSPGILFWWMIVGGLIWQFLVSMIVLKVELKHLTWQAIKVRLWLNHPVSPRTGKVWPLAYALVVPVILYGFVVESSGWFDGVSEAWVAWIPSLALPEYLQIQSLARPEFRGDVGLLLLLAVSSVFNYLLGEELFFRGILLPKMRGVFGKFDWAANGWLFAAYHLHKIEEVPLYLIGSVFTSFLNRRYRSFYPGLLVHGVEFIPLAIAVWAVFLGWSIF